LTAKRRCKPAPRLARHRQDDAGTRSTGNWSKRPMPVIARHWRSKEAAGIPELDHAFA
jgi:hypothetical protein